MVLRERWERLKRQIDTAEHPIKAACLKYIRWRVDPLSKRYASSSRADRKRIRRQATKVWNQLADAGDWPSALGLGVMLMNMETRYLPGDDAEFVKMASDALITEARSISSSVSSVRMDRTRVDQNEERSGVKARATVREITSGLEQELAPTAIPKSLLSV